MDKFTKEFYASRIEDWITKYIKLKELRRLIKSIENDIKKNGGTIIRMSDRVSMANIEEFRKSRISTRVSRLDRHSVSLDVLENTDGLFNKNEKIFNSPVMYEINETFTEIEDLEFCDDIKIFLYFLSIEIHNVYVFYLSIEKNIFNRVNGHLYSRKKYKTMSKDELLEELVDLTDITYLTYTFYNYIQLNIEAIREILKYFDDHFQILNDNISLHKLFIRKNLSKKESDLKYIMSFKIIIESSALIESFYQEIQQIDNSKEIKGQIKELKEVLSYLNETNTDLVNDDIYEVYYKKKKSESYTIEKRKKNINIDMQNSFFIDVHQQDNYYKRLGEIQYDKDINIIITKKNYLNLLLLYFHNFIYSLFYVIPYISLYFLYVEQKIDFYYLGIILTSTHLGNFISKIIINYFEKYKLFFIFYYFFLVLSFFLTVVSEYFIIEKENDEPNKALYLILNVISRLIYGFCCERTITRKYIMLYLPESEIKYYSLIYIIISHLGLICGVTLNLMINLKEPTLDISILTIGNHSFLFFIGFCISFLYLFVVLFLFTEPTGGNMLSQKISISSKNDSNRDSTSQEKESNDQFEYKNVDDESDSEENEEKNEKIIEFEEKKHFDDYENEKLKEGNFVGKDSDEIGNDKNDSGKQFRINTISTESRGSSTKSDNVFINNLKNKKNEVNKQSKLSEPLKKKSKSANNSGEMKRSNSYKDEIMSADELKGLNSLEKNLIKLNDNDNYDDMNLLPKELIRIKNNQYNSNRNYICPFFVIVTSLLFTNSLKEFILLSMPLFFLEVKDNYTYQISENNVTITIIILIILSFPFINFIKMIKAFNIERRLLLICYGVLVLVNVIVFITLQFFGSDGKTEPEKEKGNLCLTINIIVFAIIYILSNLVEGATNLLSYKIIPSFVKICHISNKYIISYITVIGKILGGIIYIVLLINDKYSDKVIDIQRTSFFKHSPMIFLVFTIVSFLTLLFCYKSLRVRAISKLFYIND